MYNLYIPLCGLIVNITLFILYMYRVSEIRTGNRIYLIMLIDSFIMTASCICSVYLTYVDYNGFLVELSSKIECFAMLNYFINLMLYVIHTCDLNLKKMATFNYVTNLIMFLAIFLGPINLKTTNDLAHMIYSGLPVNITVIGSALTLCLTLIIAIKNKKILEERFLPIVLLTTFFVAVIIVRILKPEFIYLEFLIAIATLIMYNTLENPDLKLIRELNIAKQQADKSNQAKTDFLSSMSHEIRTPLNAIVGFNQCILESKTLEEAKENSKDIITAARTLLEIINGILDISKIESGKLELVNVKYKPRVLFDEITRMLEPRMLEKNLEFSIKIAPDLPYRLRGDQANLKKCIVNLLTNAVKYTDEGSVIFNVSCINQDNICKLIISVEDTGRGIKKEYLDKIFTKFQRLEEDRNSAIEGTGLGLAITKQIIELMGGKVVVQSIYQKGSKFTIFVSQEIVNMEQSKESKNRITVSENSSMSFKDKRVLVVDDNNLNLKVALKLLERYGINIDTATSGEECINKVRESKYDLILMDDMMPNMSGPETFHILKEDKEFDTPVIALTANALVGMRENYLKDGFAEYLSKPIDREELEKILKHFLGNNRKKPINFDDTETLVLDFSSLKN